MGWDEELRWGGPGCVGRCVCKQRLLGGVGLVYWAGPRPTVRTAGWWGRKSGPACLRPAGRGQPGGVTINSQLLGPWPVGWNFFPRQVCFHEVLLPGACDRTVDKQSKKLLLDSPWEGRLHSITPPALLFRLVSVMVSLFLRISSVSLPPCWPSLCFLPKWNEKAGF